MPLSEAGMAAAITAAIGAVPNNPNQGQTATPLNPAVLQALCKGIIDHIKANIVVVSAGPDPQGGTQTVTSTSVT